MLYIQSVGNHAECYKFYMKYESRKNIVKVKNGAIK